MHKTILVVDDEHAFLMAVRRIFSKMGSSIDTVDSREEAEVLLARKPYDVVITDLRLTGINGEEGFDIIRKAKELNPDTQCVLLSGSGDSRLEEKALAQGASYFFEKPVSATQLFQFVTHLEAHA
jgi:DNA-binding NtrC family response regulator